MNDRDLQDWGDARRMPDPSPAEARRLVARAEQGGRRWLWWLLLPVVPVGLVGLAAAIALTVLWWRWPAPDGVPTPSIADVAPPVLGTGSHPIGDDRIEVDGAVVARREEGRTILELRQGAVTVQAAARAPGEQLVVVADGWQVTVVGTRFTVIRDPFLVDVAEGVVDVGHGETRWTLRAGDRFEGGRPIRRPTSLPPLPELTALRKALLAGDTDGARAGLQTRLARDAADVGAWTLLGQLEARAKRRDEAVAAWTQVVAHGKPAEAQRARFEAAVLLEDRPSDVVALLRAFLATPDPLAAEAGLRLGRAELAVGETDAGRRTLESVVREHPGTGPAEAAQALLRSE